MFSIGDIISNLKMPRCGMQPANWTNCIEMQRPNPQGLAAEFSGRWNDGQWNTTVCFFQFSFPANYEAQWPHGHVRFSTFRKKNRTFCRPCHVTPCHACTHCQNGEGKTSACLLKGAPYCHGHTTASASWQGASCSKWNVVKHFQLVALDIMPISILIAVGDSILWHFGF